MILTQLFFARRVAFLLLTCVAITSAVSAQILADPTFDLASTVSFQQVVQPDGKVIVFGVDGAAGNEVFRLNTDGSRDNTFSYCGCELQSITSLKLMADGRMVVGGRIPLFAKMIRLNANGSVDPTFLTTSQGITPPLGKSYFVVNAVLPDGKVLAARHSGSLGNYSVDLRRYNSNGSVDDTFAQITLLQNVPAEASVLVGLVGDGRFYMGATIITGKQAGVSLRRRNSDGSLDGTWSAPAFEDPMFHPEIVLTGLSLESNGNVLAAGRWITVNGQSKRHVVRLLTGGGVDPAFNPPPGGAWGGHVQALADGKMLVSINTDSTTPTYRLVRLNSNGSLDNTFALDPTVLSISNRFVVDPSGRIVVAAQLTSGPRLIRLLSNGSLDSTFSPVLIPKARTPFDFNGDGRADITVFRPSNGVWYELYSGGTAYGAVQFGAIGDIPVPADFDGDGVTDEAIFRPSTGDWWYFSSLFGYGGNVRFGQNGDIPRPSDFDGDGKVDFIVYRPSDQIWYRAGTLGSLTSTHFGAPGDIPLNGDFDGDGKGDIAVFRPSTGVWWHIASSVTVGDAVRGSQWGQSGDLPVPEDYDADGKTDFAVFRPSDSVWYINYSGGLLYRSFSFGAASDRPVPADYNGDGVADIAVFRPSNGTWYFYFNAAQWGIGTDMAIPNVYLP